MGHIQMWLAAYLLCIQLINAEDNTKTVATNISADFYTFEAGDVLDSTEQGDIDEALEQVIRNLDSIFIYNIAAIGLANQKGVDFVNTRWYIDNGELAAAPPYNISQGYTALEGFPAASAAFAGPEGIWSYDIKNTAYMVVVAWSVPFDDNLYEEKFNVKIYPSGLAVNEDMHSQMMDYGYWLADSGQYQTRCEYGVDILGFMTEADYAKIIVWVETDEFDETEGPEHYCKVIRVEYAYNRIQWWFGDYCWRTCNIGYCWIDKGCSGDLDCLWEDTKDYPCSEGHDGC